MKYATDQTELDIGAYGPTERLCGVLLSFQAVNDEVIGVIDETPGCASC